MVKEFHLTVRQRNAGGTKLGLTDAPTVIGKSMSKIITWATNFVTNGTSSVGGHKTVPMLHAFVSRIMNACQQGICLR
jgi:hypothetical protein